MNAETKLKQNNRDWYLIQRYKVESTNKGPQLHGDYMGAAEFEWGAVSRAWGLLQEMKKKGNIVKHNFRDEIRTLDGKSSLIVICHKDEDVNVIADIFRDLVNEKFYTKESPYFYGNFINDPMFDTLQAQAWLTVPHYSGERDKAKTEDFRPVFMTIHKIMASHVLKAL